LDLQSLIGPLQTALVPVVLASTGGLLCLVVQTRYGRIVDRIRELSRDPSADMDVERMLEMLFKRARHAKWSLFGLFFGISCFLTLSLVILVSLFFPAAAQLFLIVTIFVFGMASMLIGVWYEVSEMWTSFKGLALEYSIYQKKIKK
jgi:hypothetical protein